MNEKAIRARCAQFLLGSGMAALAAGCGYGSSSSKGPTTSTVAGAELATFKAPVSLGSTVDPVEHGGNPYGLTVATQTSGLITKGDFIVCNFNDGATNTQGLGTTIVGLHPALGAQPYHIAQSADLQGCSSLTSRPAGSRVATASHVNETVLVSSSGAVTKPFADPFFEPWSVIYATHNGTEMVYVSNVTTGSIDRIDLNGDAQSSFTEIATGFSTNQGVPGSISAPAGLTYNAANDTLYVVDTNANRVVALAGVSAIGLDGVAVTNTGTFTGPSAGSASVIASGAPLNGPISGALLTNGHILVGNTLDPNGTNLILEISPAQGVIAKMNVDTGAGGAIFGMVAVPTNFLVPGPYGTNTIKSDIVYVNDDNTNTVLVLSQ